MIRNMTMKNRRRHAVYKKTALEIASTKNALEHAFERIMPVQFQDVYSFVPQPHFGMEYQHKMIGE